MDNLLPLSSRESHIGLGEQNIFVCTNLNFCQEGLQHLHVLHIKSFFVLFNDRGQMEFTALFTYLGRGHAALRKHVRALL